MKARFRVRSRTKRPRIANSNIEIRRGSPESVSGVREHRVSQHQELKQALQTWAEQRWATPVRVDDVADLGGHSGQTLGFSVRGDDIDETLVIRLAPAGVAHRGATDVLRQAPLLRALRETGARVAAVVDAGGDPRFFGVPYLIVERLPGRPLIMGPDAGPSWLPAHQRQLAHELAAAQLARIHAADVAAPLRDWDRARSPAQEIDFWTTVLERGRDDGWLATGRDLRERLLATQPAAPVIGLCHGDYQTNNILFENGDELRVTGVVDWEIAGFGATELDLAWFLMMNDAAAWHPLEQRGGLDLQKLVDSYEQAAARRVHNLDWFRALACFRIAAIAALNIRLHRSGRRPDAAWERAALSVPIMFEHGRALLDKTR